MTQNNSLTESENNDSLWKHWLGSVRWQDKLHKRAAHKALDIPEDMSISTTNVRGIGPLGAVGIALAGGLPAAGLAALMYLNSMSDEGKLTPKPPSLVPENPPHTGTDIKSGTREFYKVESRVRSDG